MNKIQLENLLDELEYVYKSDDRPWIIGYSGGKDSSVVVQLVYMMVLRLSEKDRKKHIYIVSSDTLVENPIIKSYLHASSAKIQEHAKQHNLPISSVIVHPDPKQSFWANIIGRGFPTPKMNGRFRWCTDRLKIRPTSDFIKSIIDTEKNEVIILLGVRKQESASRKKSIEKREIHGKHLSPHPIDKAYVYNPIAELSVDDVWDILNMNGQITPWGWDNSQLIQLYSDAQSGECPFAAVTNTGDHTQSCGKSRFGCWTCPVVKDDKSLKGFIVAGHKELIPLAKFREWLISIRDLDQYRESKRRNGQVYVRADGSLGLGPFTWEARQMILRKLLQLEKQMDYPLITIEELKAIDQIWDEELDLSRRVLVDLYYEETGKKLPWHDLKKPLFDEKTLDLLKTYANQYNLPYDLVKKLILLTHENKNYSNPRILKSKLEKVFNQQWLHHDYIDDYLKEFEDETEQDYAN
ncbi:DNA phosphorothioation system sulfurtransferase DndC [Defluviitalea raffinosedens]|uniref:DNA phosphorothioation system sulfurtransferase DndC n=1 Tax=Defluviitalea raffinosedens TaxID=1450156 RepID=UPI0019585786|nr:DNA phosphorothioation system sulfurtransferase DndC [Defluviitalea raffinosedens]MBM7685981.1 DNA sulfur modification protein DndC [Defluviitalea raffinosedens]